MLFLVSASTLFVSIVPRARFVEAMSLLAGSRAFAFVGGPAAGGVLVQVLSAPLALAADAVSFLASAVALLAIRPVEPPREERGRGLVMSGLRFIARSPVARSALAATATINFFNFVFLALFILYATRSLGVEPAALGLVLGTGAVGGLAGSFLTGRLSRWIGLGRATIVGCVLFPAPLLLVPAAGGPRPVVLAMLCLAELGASLGVMVLDISLGSIFAALVPPRLRARVSGAYMVVNYGVRPIGALVAGALGTAIGLRPTLWIAAAGGVLGVLWLIPSPLRSLRDLPSTDDSATETA